jgi:hypothetical protein
MSDSVVGMGPQDSAERQKFENELNRIIQDSAAAGVTLRVIGSLAFQFHCPTYGYLQAAMGRAYTDIDFAGYSRERNAVRDLMSGLGYAENREVTVVSEGMRMIFESAATGLHVDVFYDKLDFCHEISWKNGRLGVDSPTLPLAELLLEKMQIVRINEKDIIDTIMLLLEHPLGDTDQETINIKLVAELCADDWGLWRTTTMNLGKVNQLVTDYNQLNATDKTQVASQVGAALQRISDQPKSLAWRLRDRVGDRVKWYKEVDEV